MARKQLAGEHEWLASVVADLSDDSLKLVYADWLEERGDDRSHFLRAFVAASRSMDASDFPDAKGLPEEWLELIGYRLVERIAKENQPELKAPALRLARPSLRMKKSPTDDDEIAVRASKIGGLPDLPLGFAWPTGGDCHAIYEYDPGGADCLAGFLAQVNFAEVAGTKAARDLPADGVLSFFCFQDVEDDIPGGSKVKAVYFPDLTALVRTTPPKELTEGNEVMPAQRLTFEETLDLPEIYGGPWSKELKPGPGDHDAVLDHFRRLNGENFLGYAKSAGNGLDPTPSRRSRHLIILLNAADCWLHIQLDQDDLAAHNFDKITLVRVDWAG
jgi:uncharacterized protein (TIGR02996 family)